MVKSETGWPKGWPHERGFYWSRDTPEDTNILLVEIQANRLTICGDDRRRNVKEAFEDSEFLGPLSPSDTEQLIRLRESLRDIRDGDTLCTCEHDTEFCCVKVGHYCAFCIAATALREALQVKAEKGIDHK